MNLGSSGPGASDNALLPDLTGRAVAFDNSAAEEVRAERRGPESLPPSRPSRARSWLRPHRGIPQESLPLYLGFVEFVHNIRARGKRLLGASLASC